MVLPTANERVVSSAWMGRQSRTPTIGKVTLWTGRDGDHPTADASTPTAAYAVVPGLPRPRQRPYVPPDIEEADHRKGNPMDWARRRPSRRRRLDADRCLSRRPRSTRLPPILGMNQLEEEPACGRTGLRKKSVPETIMLERGHIVEKRRREDGSELTVRLGVPSSDTHPFNSRSVQDYLVSRHSNERVVLWQNG